MILLSHNDLLHVTILLPRNDFITTKWFYQQVSILLRRNNFITL